MLFMFQFLFIFIFFCPSTQSRTRKTLSIVLNNGFSFGVHCVEEGDHIPPAAGLWPGIETEIS